MIIYIFNLIPKHFIIQIPWAKKKMREIEKKKRAKLFSKLSKQIRMGFVNSKEKKENKNNNIQAWRENIQAVLFQNSTNERVVVMSFQPSLGGITS